MTNADRTRTRSDWSAVRLHVVTGKGGTGKTTVAGALALALAAGGARHGERRVLLVEVEGRQGVAQLFDTPPAPYEERRVAVTPDGGEVWALAIDAEQALLEYLDMFYKLGPAARALRRFGAIDFATTVAPGIRDVLLTGKTCEAVRRRAAPDAGRGADHDRVFHYDAVVMDAPPTGRITRFLAVNSEVSGLARVGPIRNQADAVMRVLTSAQTAVHFVTLLEEMPVQETLDSIAELRDAGLPAGGVIVNQARPVVLPEDRLKKAAEPGGLDLAELADGLRPVGLADPDVVAALAQLGSEHARRVLLESGQRDLLAESGAPMYELPQLADGIDRVGLDTLAAELRRQGAA
ncbi:MAG TPA: ArsA-related P-loop ATPase [Actinocrinis sp.]|uniref:ArsA-related P-loop ATPase n=1 Tax=Actinocrinis sp. TaxID=1920516 RepID=UPI002DDCD02C|nr:ArsA-related P-loop ATPase [Actinocrinis sp.]HEV3168762.1 ArsA-related P-loop ATPase [Actinocrinis sp.]